MIKKEGTSVLIENGSQDERADNKLKNTDKRWVHRLQRSISRPNDMATQIENFNPQMANTSRILGQLFGVLASTSSTAPPKGVDIILILGQDSAASVDATG